MLVDILGRTIKLIKMENKFVNHTDPTTPIDLKKITLEQQYAKLTESEKLQVACKILGMNHVPVDFKTFLFDDYFLGNITDHGKVLFKYWLDKFDMIFPNPVTTKTPYLSFTGCIGSGKSFISKMLGLYMYHRLDCCENIFRSLGLAESGKIAYGFFHASEETAKRDFVHFYKSVFDSSPYFKNLYNNPPIRLISSGPKSVGSVIGTQLIFSVLSEIGFWKPQDASEKMDEVLGRYRNRFAHKRFNFGMVIADSSAKDSDHGASQRFEEIVPPKELFKISPSHWEVRPEVYSESNGQTFDFYIGDSKRLPKIIEENENPLTEGLDLDRIIKVPISAKFNFIANPVRSLQDLAGVPYTGTSLFFGGDLSHVLKCSSIRNIVPEEVIVDFYDKSDTIYSHVAPMIYRIPKRTNLFVHYDIGLKKDRTGVSLCYYSGEVSSPDGKTMYPTFKIPLCFVVSRLPGQSTSLDHLYQFLRDLIRDGYYITFSADSFASAGLFQSCERDGIEYKAISIDKTMDAGIALKNIINTDRLEIPYNNIFLRECSEIRVVTNGKNDTHMKLDHPLISSCTDFDYKNKTGEQPGTKDLFDAVSGSIFSCLQHYSSYDETGVGGGFQKSLAAFSKLTTSAKEESQKAFQSMLEDIY
jgi:hypothetical protein